jgi:hypothetical protein
VLGADAQMAALLFWKIPSLSNRLTYTSMLVAGYIQSVDHTRVSHDDWKKLARRISELSSFRNNLAHQPATETSIIPAEDEVDGLMMIIPEGQILPNSLDPHKKDFKPIKIDDLEAHKKDVADIRKRLDDFIDRLKETR